MIRNKLKTIIERDDTQIGRWFNLTVQLLIVLSLISLTIETLPDLPTSIRSALRTMEVTIVLIFTLEYVLRIIVADDKRRFVFSFYGIADLLAIAPFYLSLGVDLRSVRAFRLLRLFRLFKLVRYSRAAQRFYRAFRIAKEELVLFGLVALILVFLSAVGIYYFERGAQPELFGSIPHSLWWAIVTLTTVGYGDAYPITAGGRIFTAFVLMIGLGIVAVPAGLMASSLSKARQEDIESG